MKHSFRTSVDAAAAEQVGLFPVGPNQEDGAALNLAGVHLWSAEPRQPVCWMPSSAEIQLESFADFQLESFAEIQQKSLTKFQLEQQPRDCNQPRPHLRAAFLRATGPSRHH